MTVRQSKLAPDHVFWRIWQQMKRSEALSLPEFKENVVDRASSASTGVIFDHGSHVKDYKK